MNLSVTKITCFAILLLLRITGNSQELTPKQENGKWGFVDSKDEWIIKPKFIAVNKFSEGLAAFQKGIKWGFINTSGEVVIKPVYGYVNDFKEGKAAVLSFKPIPSLLKEENNRHKWGFINQTGELIIPYKFRNTFPFENNIALVANWGQLDKELYMIDENGNAISPAFVAKQVIDDDLLKIKNIRINGDSTYMYIKHNGEKVTNWYINDFDYKNLPAKVYLPSDLRDDTMATTAFKGDSREPLCAMLGKEGKVFTNWFNTIGQFTQGYAPAQYNHKWGIIDADYKWVLQPTYLDIELIEEGFYLAQINTSTSLLLNYKGDKLSEEVGNIEVFDSTFHQMSYEETMNRRVINFKSLFDKNGKQRTGWYQNINPFYNGITRIEEEKTTKFNSDSIGLFNWYNYAVDSTGEVLCFWRAENKIKWDKDYRKFRDSILNFLFAPNVNFHITPEYFQNVFTKDFHLNIKEGEIIFQGGNYREGMALVSKSIGSITIKVNGLEFNMDDVRYGYINWLGKQVIPYKFKEASSFSDGKAIIAENNKYGAIDFTGKVLIKPQYQLMGDFGDNLAPVFKDSLWGYINSNNKLIVDFLYDEARPYKYGYAPVKKGKEWALIDTRGNIVLDFNYRKPPRPISKSEIEVLQKGVGYVIIDL